MNFFSFSGLFTTITTCLLSLFILFRAKKKIHFIWVFFCWSVAVWGIGVYKIGIETEASVALFWWRMAYVGVIFIPALYLHFICELINKKNKYFIFFIYLVSLVFVYLNIFTNIFINQVKYVFDGFYYITNPSVAYNIFVIWFFASVFYAALILNKEHKISRGHCKGQIKCSLIATYIGYGGGFFAFLPVYGIYISPTLNILVALFPIIVTYTILKHRMMDIRVVVQRGVIYSFLLATIVGFYITILLVLDLFFQQMVKVEALMAGFITAIIGIYTVPFIEKYFRQKTDKFFFKDKYDYSQAIFELSQVLNKNLNLDSLLAEIHIKIQEIIKAKYFRIVFRESGLVFDRTGKFKEIEEKNLDYFFKIIEKKNISIVSMPDIDSFFNDKEIISNKKYLKSLKFAKNYFLKYNLEIGVLVYAEKKIIALFFLGKKLSGDIYSKEDFNLLKTFSYQAGVALEKARLFEEVRGYSMQLEKKVKQRTAKIKGLQEEQEQMIHEMAHGLQTPLTILKSELALASKEVVDDKKFKLIERSIDRISKMIYDMLRLAKLESDRKEEAFSDFNLSELLEELIESFEIIASAQNIELKHKIEPGVLLYGSSNEIEELVTNLVSNSMKYIKDDGYKKIFIELKKKNNKIYLEISDTGIGMSKDSLSHLFKRFYRAKSDPKYFKKGTGLGLVIAKKIAERHKGKIKVHSELGQGTKFTIIF